MSDTQLDHIKYMGLTRRREGATRETYAGRPARENPPQEPGRAAFQSPLLEYSAALGEGLLSPYYQPGPPPLHRALRYTHTHSLHFFRHFSHCQTIVSRKYI